MTVRKSVQPAKADPGPSARSAVRAAGDTPLARTLSAQAVPQRVTPLDVFALARQKWLDGERLDIGRIAKELGIGRATVFRWVGSREQLYGEIISAAFAEEMKTTRAQAVAKGPEGVAQVSGRLLKRLHKSEPLRRFIAHDPEYALRVLTSNTSPVQSRVVELHRQWFSELEQAGELSPALDVATLAYIVVRIGEAFLYGDTISDRKPEFEKATAAIRILVSAPRSSP